MFNFYIFTSTEIGLNEHVYLPAPRAVVGGRNMPARDAANTAPRPMASGARMFRNSPDGAQTATVLSPPTTPAVYLHHTKFLFHIILFCLIALKYQHYKDFY